ncbi:MAG: LytTR family DNA-binding domain-containing protein [Bacteroidota bacterium]
MKILIIEDEPPIAEDIKEMCGLILSSRIEKIDIAYTINDAENFLANNNTVDLCLLDLNLKGKNGYEILKRAAAGSFHTIIISAYTNQAIEAFNYGVLDFVPKPVDMERFRTALNKFTDTEIKQKAGIKFLVVRKHNSNHLISVEVIKYFEAHGYIVKLFMKDGKAEIIEKPLNRLMQILPDKFIRIHRSYIVDINEIISYKHKGGGVYEVILKQGEHLPLSSSAYKTLQQLADKK